MNFRRSGISYCDFSGGILNFIIGCTPVSEGCQNCYARALYDRWNRDFSQIRFYPEKLKAIRSAKLDPNAEYRRGIGKRPIAFPVDLGDIAHLRIDDETIKEVLTIFAMRSDIDWLVLTKRIERLATLLNSWNWWISGPPPNIAVGTTAENQRRANERLKHLFSIPGYLWISAEPLLEPVTLLTGRENDIVFIAVGGESGANRRPFDSSYATPILRQATNFSIPFFGKQSSGFTPGTPLMFPDIGEVKQLPVFGRRKA